MLVPAVSAPAFAGAFPAALAPSAGSLSRRPGGLSLPPPRRARELPLFLSASSTGSASTTTLTKYDDPLPALSAGYTIVSAGTTAAWTWCSYASLATHATLSLPVVHNAICIFQALTPLPILWYACKALASASGVGWKRLNSQTYRRLNLGLVATFLWQALAVWFAPLVSANRVAYQGPLLPFAMAVHSLSALFCLYVWVKSIAPSKPWPSRVVRGVVGSLWRLSPKSPSDDPSKSENKDGRNEYALLCALFSMFTLLAASAPFPLGGSVPSILGRRLGRAFGSWTLLSAVTFYCLKDASERSRTHASTFVALKTGIAAMSASHLLLVPVRLILEPGLDLYPGAIACGGWSVAALLGYWLALTLALKEPPPRTSGRSDSGERSPSPSSP